MVIGRYLSMKGSRPGSRAIVGRRSDPTRSIRLISDRREDWTRGSEFAPFRQLGPDGPTRMRFLVRQTRVSAIKWEITSLMRCPERLRLPTARGHPEAHPDRGAPGAPRAHDPISLARGVKRMPLRRR